MLLTLTDHLTCPRCGPTAGLIVLMEHAEKRRIQRGSLGCPVCRTRYGIEGGVADLRAHDAGAEDGPGETADHDRDRDHDHELGGFAVDPQRLAALLGMGEGRGFVFVDGPGALVAGVGIAGLGTDYEVVVALEPGAAGEAEGQPVSALLDSGPLPIGTRSMRAVASVGGVPGEERLKELVRVCRPTGRVVVEAGTAGVWSEASLDGVAALLGAEGAEVRARDTRGLVAVVVGR